jgi:hypothetical protein
MGWKHLVLDHIRLLEERTFFFLKIMIRGQASFITFSTTERNCYRFLWSEWRRDSQSNCISPMKTKKKKKKKARFLVVQNHVVLYIIECNVSERATHQIQESYNISCLSWRRKIWVEENSKANLLVVAISLRLKNLVSTLPSPFLSYLNAFYVIFSCFYLFIYLLMHFSVNLLTLESSFDFLSLSVSIALLL